MRPLVLAGAGCAGLSLAVRLVRQGVRTPIVLVDPRSEYQHDRTWSSWRTGDLLFPEAVSAAWTSWRVASSDSQAIASSRRHPYLHVAAGDFYRAALAELAASGSVELRLGERVEAICEEADRVVVQTDRGEIEATLAFDSRAAGRPRATLLQQFAGARVSVDRPIFDPSVCTLMDFQPAPIGAVRFRYVLPFTEREALIEATWLTPDPLEWSEIESGLDDDLQSVTGSAQVLITDTERGVLPMDASMPHPSSSPRVIPIGVRGGMIRPSSGYAFAAIQRQTQRLAASVAATGRAAAGPVWRPRTRLLDRVFLRFLRHRPERAAEAFLAMFSTVPGATIARFMNDESSWSEDLAVIRAMPTGPLARAAVGPAWAA